MISYTDGEDTKPFMKSKSKLKSTRELKHIVSSNLKKLFPNLKIPKPTYFKAHVWIVGCHHWKPKYNSEHIQKDVLNPRENVYTCGEGFSNKQAWMEGAFGKCT